MCKFFILPCIILFSAYIGRYGDAINLERKGDALLCLCSNYIGHVQANELCTLCNVRVVEYLKVRRKTTCLVPLEKTRNFVAQVDEPTAGSSIALREATHGRESFKTDEIAASIESNLKEVEVHTLPCVNSEMPQQILAEENSETCESEQDSGNLIAMNEQPVPCAENIPVSNEDVKPVIPIVRVEPRLQEVAPVMATRSQSAVANFVSTFDPMDETIETIQSLPIEYEEIIEEEPIEQEALDGIDFDFDFDFNMYNVDIANYSFSFNDLDFLFE